MLKRSLLLDLSFAGICFTVFANLNGIANLLFGVVAVFSPFILVFCLILCYYLFRYGKINFPLWAFYVMLGLLFVLGTISWLFYSHTHHEEAAGYYRMFRKTIPAFVLSFAVYKYIIYASDRGVLLNVLALVTFTLLIITFMVPIGATTGVFTGGFKALMYGGGRSAGLFASPNLAGVHANFSLAFVLFFIVQSRRLSLLFLLLVPIVAYAAFLTFSKATLIVAILMIVLFFGYNSAIILKMPRARRRRFAMAVVIIFFGIIAALPQIREVTSNLKLQQLQRLQQVGEIFQGKVNNTTTTDRVQLWEEAIDLIAAQPIQGWGLSGFHNLPEGFLGCHNTYLMVWGEAGILAFIAMLVFIISSYYRCFFWIRDPAYRFLSISLLFVITIQMYGSGHNGFSNSETMMMTAIVFGLIQTQRGRVGHLRYGKYTGQDYQEKLAKQNGRLH